MYDSHVQAWVRDRVRVLALMEELERLKSRVARIDAKRDARVTIAKRAAVRSDNEVVYLSGGVRTQDIETFVAMEYEGEQVKRTLERLRKGA